jgi:glycosyltransferase involved in cell wall biosynthesis
VIRLLHVTTTDISLEVLLGPQLRAFRDAGYDVHTASAPGPFSAKLASDGIHHHPLRHATRAFALGRDIAAMAELHSLFRRLRPEIVHTHNPKPGVYGRIAARAAGVPLVVNTQHGLYAQPTDRSGRRLSVYALERLAASCSHVELIQNPEDLETLARLGVPRPKLRLLGNGVDLDRFRPALPGLRKEVRSELGIEDGQVVVGAVGRLVWEKGYAEFFTAAQRLLARRRDLAVVVAGPYDVDKGDPLSPADVAAAEAAGVRFLGYRHDPDRLYAAFDIYVLASHREGFPRSAMEAAACGLPIVTTNIRGCREVVEHDQTGLLVPVRDPAALEAAIERLVGDGAARQRLGEAAAAKALQEFDQGRVIASTLDVYAGLEPAPMMTISSRQPRSAQPYTHQRGSELPPVGSNPLTRS